MASANNNHMCCSHLTICFLILVISTSSFIVEGRNLPQTPQDSSGITKMKNAIIILKEDKGVFRAQIGSRPPRCERRCSSCTRCEAIQVPTNPDRRNSVTVSAVAHTRSGGDDDTSNYKPLSWKCKCGNLIFNP